MLSIFLSLFLMLGLCSFFSMIEVVLLFFFFFLVLFLKMDWESMWGLLGGWLGLDLIGILLFSLSLWIGLLSLLASLNNIIYYEDTFKFYLLLMVLLLVICFSMLNLIGFYLFFESVLFPIVMLIAGWGNQPERLQAGIYMLFYTLGGSLPLLLFFLSLKFSLSFIYLTWFNVSMNFVMFLMGVLGFFVKMPMYLVHIWLPKAHVEAPVSGSMILAGVLLKLGVYGIIRVKMLLENCMIKFGYMVMSIILIGGVIIGLVCLCQVDVKSLIAYSSVCHMGVSLGGIFSMSSWGMYGNFLMMLGHGFCSSGLFCLINFYYERFFTRSILLLKGLGILFPYMSFWWLVFSGINMAVPPSMNLGGEIFLLGGMIKWSFLVFIPLMLIMFLSAGYSLYMFSYISHGKGWVLYSVEGVNYREMLLMFFHFFPLVFWILKMDFFVMV
uniref:NADH dehydrogenase subunit 4 n=1 Tax=Alectorobius rudis TaxID=2058922 RepID=UPI002237A6AA|nr:NADH dehydrogenase subunit 4 [Alectorobius rudis]UYB78621.1 NADH dehydrogenase subunit 4 [Alectorobius rudis]